MSNLLPYDPNACSCCTCPAPTVEAQSRSLSQSVYGYLDFAGNDHFYRTVVARGWGRGAFGASPAQIIENQVQCRWRIGASTAVPEGTCTSRVWSPGWTFPPPPSGNLQSSSLNCVAGHVSFFEPLWPDFVLNSESDIAASDPGVAPRGREVLLGRILTAEFLAEIIAAVRNRAWANSGDLQAFHQHRTDGTESLGYRLGRFRFRFKIPAAGGYRVTWNVIWTPQTWSGSAWTDGTPETAEVGHFEWDRVIPGGYSPATQGTWPVSPWFELPEPTENGRFTIASVVASCGPTPLPEAPAAVEGRAA